MKRAYGHSGEAQTIGPFSVRPKESSQYSWVAPTWSVKILVYRLESSSSYRQVPIGTSDGLGVPILEYLIFIYNIEFDLLNTIKKWQTCKWMRWVGVFQKKEKFQPILEYLPLPPKNPKSFPDAIQKFADEKSYANMVKKMACPSLVNRYEFWEEVEKIPCQK